MDLNGSSSSISVGILLSSFKINGAGGEIRTHGLSSTPYKSVALSHSATPARLQHHLKKGSGLLTSNQYISTFAQNGLADVFRKLKLKPVFEIGRGEVIRTPDPLLPKQMRYLTALHPVVWCEVGNLAHFTHCLPKAAS